MARWYVQHPGAAVAGPLDPAELQAAWKRQQIPPGTMVCAEGFSEWVPFHTVAELVGGVAPVVPTRVPASTPKRRRSVSWLVLGVVAVVVVLLGGGVLAIMRLAERSDLAMLNDGLGDVTRTGVAVYETREAFEKQMKLSTDAPDSQEFIESMFKVKREAQNTRVVVRHTHELSYAGYNTSFDEVEIVEGPDTGKRVFTKANSVLAAPPIETATTPTPPGQPMSPAALAQCRSACFTRRVHELEAQGRNANNEPGGPGLVGAQCESDCQQGR